MGISPPTQDKHVVAIRSRPTAAMGFQQELYEIDLERGDGAVIPPLKSPSRFYIDSAISWAVLLLLAANMVDPLGKMGRVLAVLALTASTFGAVALVRRRLLVYSSRKILLLLFICWAIYATRVYCLRARRSSASHRPRYVLATKMQRDPTFKHDVSVAHHMPPHPAPGQIAAENAIKFVMEDDARQPNAGSRAIEEQEAILDETRVLPTTGTDAAVSDGHEQDGIRNREIPDAQNGDAWFVPDSALMSSFA